MLQVAKRRQAVRIGAGEEPKEGTESKVILYGLLARAFQLEDIQTIFKRANRIRSFSHLQEALERRLIRLAIDGYNSLSRDEQSTIEDRFAEIYRGAATSWQEHPFYSRTQFPVGRMILGARSAARRQTLTLRTIAKEASVGEPVTKDGLIASQRVPLKLSLLHLLDLKDESDGWRRRWYGGKGSDGGEVLIDEVCRFNPDRGLFLNSLPQINDNNRARAAHGPQIGCPASMIKGYIQGIHRVAAVQAVESGLLSVA